MQSCKEASIKYLYTIVVLSIDTDRVLGPPAGGAAGPVIVSPVMFVVTVMVPGEIIMETPILLGEILMDAVILVEAVILIETVILMGAVILM